MFFRKTSPILIFKHITTQNTQSSLGMHRSPCIDLFVRIKYSTFIQTVSKSITTFIRAVQSTFPSGSGFSSNGHTLSAHDSRNAARPIKKNSEFKVSQKDGKLRYPWIRYIDGWYLARRRSYASVEATQTTRFAIPNRTSRQAMTDSRQLVMICGT